MAERETIPADIVRATDDLLLAVRAHERASALTARGAAVEAAHDRLDRAILRHLKGHAE